MSDAYFERVDDATFRATTAVQGAWDTRHQHIAPALGLLAHVLERAMIARHPHPLALGRISYDILGTLPVDIVEIFAHVIRPGRTIELAEAVLSHGDRPAVIARAWFLQTSDTDLIADAPLPSIPHRTELDPWQPSQVWPGEYVTTVDVRRRESEPGRAQFWMRPRIPLLLGETASPTARLLGLIDIANGITPRFPPTDLGFPNVDLTAHLIRPPVGDWIGCDTTVSFGPHGSGLTHTVLHDEEGPVGTSAQTLALRPHATR